MASHNGNNDTEKIVYYQDWLFKKEGLKNWVSYWVVLRGRWLLLYDSGSPNSTGQLRKTIELRSGSNCSLVARRKRRYPFSLVNSSSTYYFKSETELQRYHWIVSLLNASTGGQKKALLSSVPKAMQEKAVFPSWDERHAYKFSGEKARRVKSAPPSNKRREKYNERKENRQRVKTENKLIAEKQFDPGEIRRDRRRASHQFNDNNVLQSDWTNREVSNYMSTRTKSMLDVRANLGFEDDEISTDGRYKYQSKERTIMVGSSHSKSTTSIPVVNIIDLESLDDDEDGDDTTTTSVCEVSLYGDDVLPNMVVDKSKESDLINLTTPRPSRPASPTNAVEELAFLHACSSTNKRPDSQNLTIKAQVIGNSKSTKSNDARVLARPTSPYLGPRSVGLGRPVANDLFSATNTQPSPRFSRHSNHSEA